MRQLRGQLQGGHGGGMIFRNPEVLMGNESDSISLREKDNPVECVRMRSEEP